MTNQTIKNMDTIVIKIVEVADVNNKGIKFESTQEVKTLINTYGTLLSDVRRMDKDDYEELNIEKELYEQGEKLKLVTKVIDEKVIPTELMNGNLKSVDNLAITSSKIKSILRDIKWMTKSYEVKLISDIFNKKVKTTLNELDNKESFDNTLTILQNKLKNMRGELDVINATYMDEAPLRSDWQNTAIRISLIEELIKELT